MIEVNDDLPPLPTPDIRCVYWAREDALADCFTRETVLAYAREAIAADRVRVEQGKSMNLHDQIMNIRAAPNELTMSLYIGDTALAYKIGHRDARHAAAELALAAAPLPKEQT